MARKKVRIQDAIDMALRERPDMSGAQIYDAVGGNETSVRNCVTMMSASSLVHVSKIQYEGSKRRFFYRAGPAPDGFHPDVIGEAPVKEDATFGRYASVFHYANDVRF